MRAVLLTGTSLVLAALVACKSDTGIDWIDDTEVDTSVPDDTEDPIVPGEPVADAGPDQAVSPLDDVVLDGAGSYDPGGNDPLIYEWTLLSRPAGSTAVLSGAATWQPFFFADLAGDYVAELRVQNTLGIWDSTPDQVTVTAKPTQGFYVQVSWSSGADLDLHLRKEPAALWNIPGDCFFCNDMPDWGAAGVADDPSLDADAIDGWGPETITIDSPASGKYRINVHYYGEDGLSECWDACPPSPATVMLYINGTLAQTWSRTLLQSGQVWDVATIDWPSGAVTFHDAMTTTTEDADSACPW